MAVRVGSARIDERGNIEGGKAGDQMQGSTPDWSGEVSMQNWYLHNKGWYVLRCKDAAAREKCAKAMEAACNNKHLGYSQDTRYTAYSWCKNQNGGNYDPAVISVDVNVDCSSLVRLCLAYAGIMLGDFYTGNMTTVLPSSGKIELITDKNITNNPENQMRGDILVTRSAGHTVIVLDNGKNIDTTPVEQWKGIGTATCTEDDVNVRATPNGTIIGQAGKGNRFEVDGQKSGDWVHINIATVGIGWMYKDYVKYDVEETPAPAPAPVADQVIGFGIAKTEMNVRQAAKTSSKVLGTVKQGAEVEILEQLSTGWLKIKYAKAAAGYAYVSNRGNQYFTITLNSEFPYVVEITADALYVRAAASKDSATKGVVHKGERYTITAIENKKWGKLASGLGYISTAYTKRV